MTDRPHEGTYSVKFWGLTTWISDIITFSVAGPLEAWGRTFRSTSLLKVWFVSQVKALASPINAAFLSHIGSNELRFHVTSPGLIAGIRQVKR